MCTNANAMVVPLKKKIGDYRMKEAIGGVVRAGAVLKPSRRGRQSEGTADWTC